MESESKGGPASVRRAAVAGQFYPKDARELEAEVRGLLGAVMETGPAPKALIAPHAGYVYSGPVAASAYGRLREAAERIHRVVLIGPAHRMPVRGIAASGTEWFETPLGRVPTDKNVLASILDLSQVIVLDKAHEFEHSLEVQLPFLQVILRDFRIVPLLVGAATGEEVAAVLERLWDGPETRIVVSSDLSHYHDYEAARRLDEAASRAIERLEPEAIGDEQACGQTAIQGLLMLAKRHGLTARTIDLRNSGDTAGPQGQVVGYGAYVFS
jgi:AmmeMemoRadiSam system protein B